MNKALFAVLGISMALSGQAETFTVDTGHAEVGFSIKHMMVSNAKGTFNTFAGTLDYDLATQTLISAEGWIDAASIDTNNKKRDDHLRNEDYFNVTRFPKITFKSTSVEKTGEGTFIVKGNLNVLGVDREVELPVTINGPVDGKRGGKLIGVECNTELNRRYLGITKGPSSALGDEVKISIAAEAGHQ